MDLQQRENTQKTKEELIKEIGQLYQKFPQVKEFYQAKAGNVDDVLANYKKIIEKEFIEGKTRGMPKTRFSVARKALNDFKKITKEPLKQHNLLAHFRQRTRNIVQNATQAWAWGHYDSLKERYEEVYGTY
ncbi:MAG: hypothetical protein D3913_15720 [Candidatus Electrothrix sp. LOE1_4_5]|nr:hypothetical protein [Candidatus Electrothrix gigas]